MTVSDYQTPEKTFTITFRGISYIIIGIILLMYFFR